MTVWPDNDEPGAEYAKKVARPTRDAGASSVRIVKLPDGLPDSWDLADDPPVGLNLDKLLAEAPEFETSTDLDEPDDFRGSGDPLGRTLVTGI